MKNPEQRLVLWDGQYWTLRQLANMKGMKYNTLYTRLYVYEMPVEKAVGKPVPNGEKQRLIKKYSEISGLPESTIRMRVNSYDVSVEESVKFSKHKKKHLILKPRDPDSYRNYKKRIRHYDFMKLPFKPNMNSRRGLYG